MSRPRLHVWTPLPPSTSGVADYAAEQLPLLAHEFHLAAVVADPHAVARVPGVELLSPDAARAAGADLDLYQVGNSPPHGCVYRALLERPGVLLLHDWCLHHLVLQETLERGDRAAYQREMRHAHGERGSFVGRQVARALGGVMLPALYPLNQRVLERALAVVTLSRDLAARVAARLPGRPVLHLPHHVALPLDPLPTRAEARRALGLPEDALVVTAPGLATRSKRLDIALAALARLLPAHPTTQLVVAGGIEPGLPLEAWIRAAGLGAAVRVTGRLELGDFVRHLVAADVVLGLRFPSHGEMSGAVVRALGLGRPVVVSAGTPVAGEFEEGVVAWVDPGPRELDSLSAVLGHLLARPGLRARMERLARARVEHDHALPATIARLAGFLRDVLELRPQLSAVLQAGPQDGLREYLADELRFGADELGLSALPLGAEDLVAELCPAEARA